MPTWLQTTIGVAAFVSLVTLTVVVIAASRRESRIVEVTDALLTLLGQVRVVVDAGAATALRNEVQAGNVAERLAADRERADLAAADPAHAAGAVADAAAGSGDFPAGS